MITPFFIVHNNFDTLDYSKPEEFRQYIKYTHEIAEGIKTGKYNLDYLLNNQIIEYISSDETQCFE